MPGSRVDVDETLIEALRADPRASVLSLSRTTGFPRALIATRLKDLIDDEFVRVKGVMHPQYHGPTIIAHASVTTIGPVGPIAELVSELAETIFVSIVAGEYDLIFESRVSDNAHLHRLLAKVRSHPNVAKINTIVFSTVYKGYLEHDPLTPISIDDVDVELLRELEQDGRRSWQELAQIVELSPSAVRARVHRMLDAGIAQIIVVQERGRFGPAITCGVGLTLSIDAASVLPQLAQERYVEFAVSTVGRFDALMTLRAATPVELFESFEVIRAYPEVTGMESWAHLNAVKEDYTRRIDGSSSQYDTSFPDFLLTHDSTAIAKHK
ncbi:Lrp/AsnC family transcriptional regulator [Gulosibacter chungangensis]|uniref:Lrp/AsnC family transcriptional regulator n=1 Tax=Gulosibacter chungangensis TaxID=979746 RepID=A0A7J5B911_9MICO|nr:Lrp/AsnC family transcriptional regulator [Gulosibacter chungangensis]KAB1641911.1 Lrp/AsnC family transcriptional regulator [Gulosibacter chungangensis]